MDESTFETFEEELGKPFRDVSAAQSLLQTRRSEFHTQRRMREEPPIVQQSPKDVAHEGMPLRSMSLRKALSIQNLAQIEAPWEGVTLNRCLLVAITILVLTSGCQRLHDVIRGQRGGADVEPVSTALYTRQAALRRSRSAPPQPETSLWETFFWWVADDDDDNDDDDDDGHEERRRGKSRKVIRERASRSFRHKPFLGQKVLKQTEESFKAYRRKMRKCNEESSERMKGRDKDKRQKLKNLEVEEQEEEKMPKTTTKENRIKAIQSL